MAQCRVLTKRQRTKVCTGDFAPPELEFRAEFWETHFGLPNFGPKFFHWEIKGRFRKRVVLANVPSFRFSFRGNIRRNHPFGNHPFVNTKKGHWEIKGRFPKGWFWRTYPRSGFRSGGTSAKTTLLETTLLRTPDSWVEFFESVFPAKQAP